MTPAQRREMRRLTFTMWGLLNYAAKMHPEVAEIPWAGIRSANTLERRGFIAVIRDRDRIGRAAYTMRLTPAGHEGLTRHCELPRE
jgi:hypothetical protein